MKWLALLVVAALLIYAPSAWAAFVPPPIQGYVTDTSGKLSAEEIQALDTKLAAYRSCAHDQIAVLVTGSLGGDTIENAGHATGTAWKLGEGGKDNGVLLVIAPNERKVRIEVGKGLEGSLTDLQSNDILRTSVSPNLKNNDFFAAIDQGTSGIATALWAKGANASCASIPGATRPASSVVATPAPPVSSGSSGDRPLPALVWVAFVGFFVALFALTFHRMDKTVLGTILPALFALFFGSIGSCVITAGATMLENDRLRALIAVAAAVLVVAMRVLYARFKPRSRSRTTYADTSSSSSSESSSTSSSYDAGSSFGSSSSSDSSSSSSSSSNDTSFGGGGGGTFGGGGSSDSY